MKLKILGSPLPSRVDDVEMEMDTLGPPKPANDGVMQRKKSRVSASENCKMIRGFYLRFFCFSDP